MKVFKALIAEDDTVSLTVLRKFVEHLGGVAVTAGDGEEAFSLLQRHNDIDILITDIIMPNLDGRGLITALRKTEQWRDLAIVIISGVVMDEDVEDLLLLGKIKFLRKPIDRTAFQKSLRDLEIVA